MAAAWRPRVQLLLHLAPPPYAQEGNALLRQLQQQVVHSTAQTQSGSKVPAMSRLVISSQVRPVAEATHGGVVRRPTSLTAPICPELPSERRASAEEEVGQQQTILHCLWTIPVGVRHQDHTSASCQERNHRLYDCAGFPCSWHAQQQRVVLGLHNPEDHRDVSVLGAAYPYSEVKSQALSSATNSCLQNMVQLLMGKYDQCNSTVMHAVRHPRGRSLCLAVD